MPEAISPTQSDRGLASANPRLVADQTLQAWNDFLRAIDAVDIDAPTRLKKTPARALIAKVGDWPESRQLPQILADAKLGNTEPIDQDAIDAAVVEANAHRTQRELIEAVERSRDSLVDWLSTGDTANHSLHEVGLQPVGSPLGSLPVLTYIHAAAFQLAVCARDLRKAGASQPTTLAIAGLRALVDTTGALASRMGIDARFAVVTPSASALTIASDEGWIVQDLESHKLGDDLPGLEGDLGLVIDVAAGRKNPLRRLRRNELVIHDMPGLLRLAPIAQENPGLPGGPILRKAAGVLSVFGR